MDLQAPVTQAELLNATTPETLAALMAKGDDVAIQGVTAPAPAPGAANAVDAAPAAPSPAPAAGGATPGTEDSSDATGVATKSGKGVLPYRVLADERAAKQHYRDRAAELEQQLQDANARLEALRGTNATPQQLQAALGDLSDEEIAQAELDIPLLGKVARALKAGGVAAPAPAPTPAPAPAASRQDAEDDIAAAVHQAMATTPLLQRLQARGGPVWDSACALDNALQNDPAWATKPMADRFAEVQRRIAEDMGVELPAASTNTPAPAPAPTPAPAPAPISNFRPNTLSDFVGGSPQNGNGISEQADGMAMANQFARMSDADIMKAVRQSMG